ncbi:spinster family MFS transporter [Parvularcula marina]|uniref:MFS transporter n=1 Tax=Parvularcula marina TaxID=2292771 RepID=A0A371RFP0_9PROT|nr:MFS transporter [Parvularcula marina]RFB04263.1 MFS transporter [Parvularcula marina]
MSETPKGAAPVEPVLTEEEKKVRKTRAYALFILVVVYTLNFIDRQIVGILAIPIKADLGLTDSQLGLMGGLAFALFYTILGIPIAMLADRKNRVYIITAALTVWSIMTAVCGMAGNFIQLFLARLGVGVGEAGGVAPAYSLLSDFFPAEKRARALSIYAFGIPIGSALGILLGGILTNFISWRSAFIIVGLLGVVVAPILALTLKEPPRGRYDKGADPTKTATVKEVLTTITKKPSFWGLSLGAACGSMMGYGLFFWIPSFLVRSFAPELREFFDWIPRGLLPPEPSTTLYASFFYSGIVLIGGLVGIWAGGVLADKYGQAKKSTYALIPAIGFALTTPFFILSLMTPSLIVIFLALMIPTALSLAWLGPVTSAFQHLVPPHMRATASAIFLFVNNLIGIGLGTYVLGALSDGFGARFGEESLRYAMLTGSTLYLVAGGLLFLTAPRLKHDWHG